MRNVRYNTFVISNSMKMVVWNILDMYTAMVSLESVFQNSFHLFKLFKFYVYYFRFYSLI